jgi:hypothetical protein
MGTSPALRSQLPRTGRSVSRPTRRRLRDAGRSCEGSRQQRVQGRDVLLLLQGLQDEHPSEPVFAFVYNVLAAPVAAGVLYPFFGLLLSPMIASAAMTFSSVSVIGNALRLRRVVL